MPALEIAIVDTNILHYGSDPNFASSVAELIKKLSEKYALVTTDYSVLELYRGLSIDKIPNTNIFFDSFTRLPVNKDIYKTAAALSTCYGNDEATKAYYGRYSDGDIIIAATAFVNNACIVTADLNDFPRPYFHEAEHHSLIISKKKKHIAIQSFRPDISYLNLMIGKLYIK